MKSDHLLGIGYWKTRLGSTLIYINDESDLSAGIEGRLMKCLRSIHVAQSRFFACTFIVMISECSNFLLSRIDLDCGTEIGAVRFGPSGPV